MRRRLLPLIFVLALAAGCVPSGGVESEATNTPEEDHTATAEAAAAGKTQFAIDAQETVYMRSSATAEARQTENPVTQEDQGGGRLATLTVIAMVKGTNQAEPMAEYVQELYSDGYISRTDGTHRILSDFSSRFAKLRWIQWHPLGISPESFVLQADINWSSPSNIANWNDSGCGFSFRIESDEKLYVIYLGLDGNVYMLRFANGYFNELGHSYYRELDIPDGKAEIALVAEGDEYTFFVNGERVYYRQDQGITTGEIGYTVASGTNKDFGTHCEFTNVELWEFVE